MKQGHFGRVLTAMVTPFTEQGEIDDDAVAGLVEHLLANGSDGIVVCGTTGESPTLSHEEKVHLFALVTKLVAKRGPVVAGTGGNDTAASIRLTRDAAATGVDAALLVVPPYNKPSQEGLYQHFKAIAHSVPDLPCMLYNVPPRTAQNMDAATTVRLAHDVSNIVSIKEASGNLMQCGEIFGAAPEGFTIYSGDDGLTLPMLAIGGVGVVSVCSHLVGSDIQKMHTAFFEARHTEAAALNARMMPVVRACFQPTTPSPAPLKAALNMRGVRVGGLRLPLVPANEKETAIVRTAMADYGLL